MKRKRSRTYKKKSTKSFQGTYRKVGYYGRYGADSKEKKFFDGIMAATALTATGSVLEAGSLINIAQDTGESDRIGRKCTVKSIHFKGQLILPTQADIATASDRYRIIVYHDKQCNGATAAVLDLLQTEDIDSFRNLENSGRFVIFYDKTQAINASAAAGNGTDNDTVAVHRHWKFNKTCNLPIEYSNTTGAISGIRSNNIGIMVISEITNRITLQFYWRVRFTG